MTAQVEKPSSSGNQRSPRPDNVPRLHLAALIGDHPEDANLEGQISKHKTFQSPSSKSTVSWGTPSSNPYALTQKDIELGGTVYRPCTHLGHNQEKHRPKRNPITHQLYSTDKGAQKQKVDFANDQAAYGIKVEKQESPTQKTNKITPRQKMSNSPRQNQGSKAAAKKRPDYWYLDDDMKPPQPSTEREEDEGYTMDEVAKMQTEYTSQPYTGLHGARKSAAEDDLAKKQKEEIMEQVLVDQLSRHVISDAEQDRDPARMNPADPASAFNTAPLRFKSRRLHDTKVSTAGAATESKLKERITFGARLVTRNGRDALRDLFGFYFHMDDTLTVYEYRLFGKNTNKALPIIERGKYCHVTGRRRGKPYRTEDIQVGKNLSFATDKQPCLPDSVKTSDTCLLRICETSTPSTGGATRWDIPSSDRDGGSDTAQERKDRNITQQVQNFIRSKLSERSVSVVVGLGRMFRSLDTSGDGKLSADELSAALDEFDIRLPPKDFEAVWRVVDENNDGAIDYGEFMRAFIGEMNETRKQVVRKVFKKLDPHKTGAADLLDLKKLFSAKKHPLVVAGNFGQSEMEDHCMTSFADVCAGREGRITYVEFAEYYEGVSIAMKRDDDFVNMMKNGWGV